MMPCQSTIGTPPRKIVAAKSNTITGCRQIVEERPMGNHVDLPRNNTEFPLQAVADGIRVADNRIDECIKAEEGRFVTLTGVVWQQVMDGEHDLRSAGAAEVEEPEIERQSPFQHWQILHVDDVWRGDEKPDAKRKQVQHRLGT